MDLTTEYLGLKLRSPLVPSASTLSESLDNIRLMEDSGAGAVVMFSLFEEQITQEGHDLDHHLNYGAESYAESLTFFPETSHLQVGTERYLKHIQDAKQKVDIPIIGSLNGCSFGGWLYYARLIEEAGADALELNIYYLPTDFESSGTTVEANYINIIRSVKNEVNIPVAVKIGPYFSNLGHIAHQFELTGADALVMFNRFYQPDIDINNLEVWPHLLFSSAQDLRLPLTWIGLLYGRVDLDFAATSGIRSAQDVVKLIMVGADVTMLCAILYQHGIPFIQSIEQNLRLWMEDHEYSSLEQMRGSMSQINCPNPSAFERAQYLKAVSHDPFLP